MKIIGSILVIFSCTAIGFDKCCKLQTHLNELEMLKHVFVLIKKEMQYTMVPLSEIFLKISKGLKGEWKSWLEELSEKLRDCGKATFQEMWDDSVKKQFLKSQLTQEELENLRQVGKNLSYIETIDLYLEGLEISIERTREDAKTKKKLYQSIAIMGGIFLVIVFW